MTVGAPPQRVLVTGASQGIGLGIARAFAEAGARVVISGRNEERLRLAVEVIGPDVGIAVGNVGTRDGCHEIVRSAVALLGGLDVLCANAGVYPEQRIEDIDEDTLAAVMSTNINGSIFSVQAALPVLEESDHGRILLTSSITGPTTGYPGLSVYGASKAAQLGFMRTAAVELASRGITVNAVSPGAIATDGLIGLGEDAISAMAKAIPSGRLGVPADIGAAAVFLASPAASFITGQELIIDGGQTLPELPELV